ncbi:MAG: antibiotic biosynthesis monooxygenase [Acidimicrobiia bacterium]
MSELLGIARFRLHDGCLAEFERLSARCVDIVRTRDPGTLQYDLYFDDDRRECVVIGRYRDSDALIQHRANIGSELLEALLATGTVDGELLGVPSRELLAGLQGTGSEGGDVRWFSPYLSL